MSWVASHPQPMTEQEVSHFACDFNGVKLSKPADAVALDPQPESIEDDELARSSPDDRPEQALNEIRESVAEELLENLLQVSPARFEVIVLDVLHRTGYGGHRGDLQRVGEPAMAALTVLSLSISSGWKKSTFRPNAGKAPLGALKSGAFMAHCLSKK